MLGPFLDRREGYIRRIGDICPAIVHHITQEHDHMGFNFGNDGAPALAHVEIHYVLC